MTPENFPSPSGGTGASARDRDPDSDGHVPLTDAEARVFRVGRGAVLTEVIGDVERLVVIDPAVAALADLLPCERCGWMRTPSAWTCTCELAPGVNMLTYRGAVAA